MSKRDDYVAKMKRQLDEWNSDIDALEAKAHRAKEHAKAKYQAQISALRAKRQEGETKLEAMKAVTEDSWEQLKDDLENAWAALKDSLHRFKSHFK